MSDTQDRAYHMIRAVNERRLAESAKDPRIAALHWQLATLYEDLVEAEEGIPPLRVVPG